MKLNVGTGFFVQCVPPPGGKAEDGPRAAWLPVPGSPPPALAPYPAAGAPATPATHRVPRDPTSMPPGACCRTLSQGSVRQ